MQARRILASCLILLGLASAVQAQERRVHRGPQRGVARTVDTRNLPSLGAIRTSYGYGRQRYARRSHAPRRIWVPASYEFVLRPVFEPGHFERVWVEPVFETRYDPCGRPRQVQVCDGYWKDVFVPGRKISKRVRVFRPGHYRTASRR